MHALIRKSSFSKAQGLHNTGHSRSAGWLFDWPWRVNGARTGAWILTDDYDVGGARRLAGDVGGAAGEDADVERLAEPDRQAAGARVAVKVHCVPLA